MQPKKICYTPGKWIFLISSLRNFLYLFRRKLFIYFGKTETAKSSCYFRKRNILEFWEVTFWSWKIKRNPSLKKFLIFGEMELSYSKLKKLLVFQKRTCKVWKWNRQKIQKKKFRRNFLYFSKNSFLHISWWLLIKP